MMIFTSIKQLQERFLYEKRTSGMHRSVATTSIYQQTFATLDAFRTVLSIDEYNEEYFYDYFEHFRIWSPVTKESRARDLSAFFNWYLIKQHGEDNPKIAKLNPLHKFRKHGIAKPKKIVSPQEFQTLVSCVKNNPNYPYLQKLRNLCILLVLYGTGIRRQELCDLALDDIDLVRHSLLVMKGKGGKSRTLTLPAVLVKHLGLYCTERNKLPSPSSHLFLQTSKTSLGIFHPITKDSVKTLLQVLEKKTGIKCNPHALRRGCGNALLQNNVNPLTIKEIYGHTDLKTTLTYIRAEDELMKEAMERHPIGMMAI